jgi:hypothetical protein
MEFFRDRHLHEYDEYVVRGDGVVRDQAWDCYDADVSLTPNGDSARYKARLLDRIIERMRNVCGSVPVPMVLMPIPHPVDVGGHATGEVDRVKYPDYRPRGMVGIVEEISLRHGIPTIDLFSVFERLGTKDTYFHGFDDHWNDHGQDVAATVAADYLIASGLLDGVAEKSPRTDERSH